MQRSRCLRGVSPGTSSSPSVPNARGRRSLRATEYRSPGGTGSPVPCHRHLRTAPFGRMATTAQWRSTPRVTASARLMVLFLPSELFAVSCRSRAGRSRGPRKRTDSGAGQVVSRSAPGKYRFDVPGATSSINAVYETSPTVLACHRAADTPYQKTMQHCSSVGEGGVARAGAITSAPAFPASALAYAQRSAECPKRLLRNDSRMRVSHRRRVRERTRSGACLVRAAAPGWRFH